MTSSTNDPDEDRPQQTPTRRRFLRDIGIGIAGATVGAGIATAVNRSGTSDTTVAEATQSPTTPTSSETTMPQAATTTPTTLNPVVPERGEPDTYVITDFGATPDAAAEGLNAAIRAAAGNGGGTVHVPAGEWRTSEAIELMSNVRLSGVSTHSSTVRSDGSSTIVRHAPTVVGSTLENLTLDGGSKADKATQQHPGTSFPAGASYCIMRRLQIYNVTGPGIMLAGDANQLFFQDLLLERLGGDGLRIETDEATSVFVSGASLLDFGLANVEAYGLFTTGRCHVNQIHVEPVRTDQVGIGFLPGSEDSTLTNFFVGLDGGIPLQGQQRARVGVGSVR